MRVANGDQVKCERSCKQTPLSILGVEETLDVFIFVLAGCDMVLGVLWFQTLGLIL